MLRVLLSLSCLLLPALAEAAPPNIVLINTDDLGINDLGCYGRKEHATPNLDRLASQGVRFTCSYCSQPICSPSRAGLMTGKWPARLHLTTYLPGRPDTRAQKVLHPKMRMELPREEITLAEVFKQAGYATACIGKWHLGGKGFLPGDQGFEVVFAGKANTAPSATEGGKGEFELTAQALAFLEANQEKPFFLYLSHHSPHIPLAARKDRVEKNKQAFNPVYAAVIESLDDTVGLVLKKLDECKLTDRTIVLFTSDNGGLHVPELREDPPTHNTPYRAGKGFLYEGGLRVPMIISWPGQFKPAVCTTPVSNIDLLPTLAALAEIKAPKNLDGVNFAPLLRGKQPLPARTMYWHFPHYNNQGGRPGGAVRQGDWKLITYYDTNTSELYNLQLDPGETTDLASSEEKRIAQMNTLLRTWLKQINAQVNVPNPDFDEVLYRQLYVETDVSKLRPEKRAADMTRKLLSWRKTMDAVVSKRKP